MDFLKQIFDEHNKVFISLLEKQGFSVTQANDFLHVVASSFSISNPDIDTPQAIKYLISEDSAKVLHSINIKSLAKKLEVPSVIVELGIKTIHPELSVFMSQKKDDILNAIISLSWGAYGQPSSLTKHIFN